MRRILSALLLAAMSASVQAQKRDTIRVKVGDTSTVGFSLRDTSVVIPVKNGFVAKSCGVTELYKRAYADSARKKPRTGGDTSVVIVSGCTTQAPPPPIVTPPATTLADSAFRAAVIALEGPLTPTSATPAAYAFYEQNFVTNDSVQWASFGPKWDAGNSISVYERAAMHYVWWVRSGNAAYLSRGDSMLVAWRDGYLLGSGTANPSPHWYQPEGLYLHWLRTKDPKDVTALQTVAGNYVAFVLRRDDGSTYLTSQAEPRIQQRVMDAFWMAEQASGTKSPYLDSAIVQSVSSANAQGFFPAASTCGGSLNYMEGMKADLLTRIHDQRPGAYNAAIEKYALNLGTYLWTTQWRGSSDPSFNYMSLLCTGTGSPTSAPDLNGTILPLFGWLGKFTKDPVWFTRGDAVWAGMSSAFVSAVRQFQESYYASPRYLGYRFPASVVK